MGSRGRFLSRGHDGRTLSPGSWKPGAGWPLQARTVFELSVSWHGEPCGRLGIPPGPLGIGSGPGNLLQVIAPGVRASHAQIVLADGQASVESEGDVVLDGAPATRGSTLSLGSHLEVGAVSIRVTGYLPAPATSARNLAEILSAALGLEGPADEPLLVTHDEPESRPLNEVQVVPLARSPEGLRLEEGAPPVRRRLAIVGRAADNDLALRHPEISKRHVAFELRDATWWIADLGSANGTTLGGARLRGVARLEGDRVVVGMAGAQPLTFLRGEARSEFLRRATAAWAKGERAPPPEAVAAPDPRLTRAPTRALRRPAPPAPPLPEVDVAAIAARLTATFKPGATIRLSFAGARIEDHDELAAALADLRAQPREVVKVEVFSRGVGTVVHERGAP